MKSYPNVERTSFYQILQGVIGKRLSAVGRTCIATMHHFLKRKNSLRLLWETQQISGFYIKNRKDGYIQNRSTKAKDKTNLRDLDRPFHGNHPQYNDYVRERLEELKKNGNFNITEIKKLQDELRKHIDDALNSDMNLNDYFKEGKHKKKNKH